MKMERQKLDKATTIIIGAGIGGLSAAIALAGAGQQVLVLERAPSIGGKIRSLPSSAGPVDTGPTVLTLKHVLETVFARAGGRLADYVTLIAQPLIARHFWQDGKILDLFSDQGANEQAIGRFAGAAAAKEYLKFDRLTREIYDAFNAPMMQARKPMMGKIALAALQRPAIWPALLPNVSLDRWLRGCFSDSRLVQLFGRYSTYVGGAPNKSPAVLALIWQAEAGGVWAVQGGMAALASGLERFALRLGVQFRCNAHVRSISQQNGRVTGVVLEDGTQFQAENVVFNGDPAALTTGLLGQDMRPALGRAASQPRSLSAYVCAFAAQLTPRAPELAHHNVFFGRDPSLEFGPISRGEIAQDPTLYICAPDRSTAQPPSGQERFEIIMNAAALPARPSNLSDKAHLCTSKMISQLSKFHLGFQPIPSPAALTTPHLLSQLFPASQGAIYGRSPQSLMAPMLRPGAQTRIKGLFLAGGGAHPGPGLPMAALSGQHAAEAILNAPTLICSPPAGDMRGGISTA